MSNFTRHAAASLTEFSTPFFKEDQMLRGLWCARENFNRKRQVNKYQKLKAGRTLWIRLCRCQFGQITVPAYSFAGEPLLYIVLLYV